jgi:hypothetical protein
MKINLSFDQVRDAICQYVERLYPDQRVTHNQFIVDNENKRVTVVVITEDSGRPASAFERLDRS